jgi:fumarate hydratase class II
MAKFRQEQDTFGLVDIPAHKLWGAQTQRSLDNFPISSETIPLSLIYAYALVKKASAWANIESLSQPIVERISAAADDILKGQYDDHFPLKVWQTGSGTHTNMNLNEVIANIANHQQGQPLGSKTPVHPNDHVNFGMSTNDSFPTAMHVATVMALKTQLIPALQRVEQTFSNKVLDFQELIKVGRTHMQDATPITLGQEFSGYQTQLKLSRARLDSMLPRLLALAMGGTAVGTGLNSTESFPQKFIHQLNAFTGYAFTEAENKFEAIAAHDALVELSGGLNTLAVSMMKIANDLRLLSSGPRCGIGELELPANEVGSSIMPGKINPSQIEALTMVCAQVMGNHMTVTIAGSNGQLELNAFKPVIIYNVLKSIELLRDALVSFDERCLQGISPNFEKIEAYLQQSLMLVTALNPIIGYDKAAEVATKAYQEKITLKQTVAALGYLSEEAFDEALDLKNMTQPKKG